MTIKILDIPFAFECVATLRNAQNGRHCWVTPKTDLMIEGFPRSANTYLHRIVREASNGRLTIAHHVHRPQQVIMALKYEIPCFVTVRHPQDAIASYEVRTGKAKTDKYVRKYIDFAEVVLNYKKHERLRILPFDQVISDPSKVASEVLRSIGLEINVTAELIAKATLDTRRDATRSSLPNEKKEQLKANRYQRIQNTELFKKAVSLFEDLVAAS